MRALVKFLSGPQNGAEIVLEPGDYVLGSGDEADLFLSDAAVKPRHAVLAIGEKEWRIEPAGDAEMRVGGQPLRNASILKPFDVMTLGGVNLAIGPDEVWPSVPGIPAPEAEQPEPAAAAPEAPKTPPADTAAQPDEKPPQTRRRSRVPVFLLLAAAAAAAGYWWYAQGGFTFEPSLAERTAERLRGRGYGVEFPGSDNPRAGTIAVRQEAGGRVELSGLVATKQDRDAVLAAGGFDAGRFSQNLKAADEDVDKANAAMHMLFPRVELARGDSPFAVRIIGLVKRVEDNNAAFRLARDMLDPRITIRRGLAIWPVIQEEANRELQGLGMANARFRMMGDRAILESPAWPDQKTRLELLRRLEDRYGAVATALFAQTLNDEPPKPVEETKPPPVQVVTLQPLLPDPVPSRPPPPPVPELSTAKEPAPPAPSAPPPPPPPSGPRPPLQWHVQSITRKGFVDQNGAHHAIGDVLGGTMRLVDVWPNGVVLQQGRETIFAQSGSLIIKK